MKFDYRAISLKGVSETGVVDATSEKDAMRKLASESKTVFELVPSTTPKSTASENRKIGSFWQSNAIDPVRLFDDLALLMTAGLTVSQALESLRKFGGSEAHQKASARVLSQMAAGNSATDAFRQLDVISNEALAMISSGENSGNLPKVFSALAAQLSERSKNRASFLNALAYPFFLIILMIAALSVVTFVLVPAIAPVFENSGKEAPFAIRFFVGLRYNADIAAPFLILIIASVLFVFLMPSLRQLAFRRFASIGDHLPFYKTLVRNSDLSRYLSSLSMLLENGVPMAQALSHAAVSGSTPQLREKLGSVRNSVSGGRRLADALQDSELFDWRTLSIVAVGNEAGKLPIVIHQAATILEQSNRKQLDLFLAVLTPSLTIFMGVVIGGLIVSVMSALLAVNELAVQ